MAKKPSITIVGPGNLGRALGGSLRAAGYRIDEIISRGARSSRQRGRNLARILSARPETMRSARLHADIIWFCVPDREIAAAAGQLTKRVDWQAKLAFHSSGALPSDQLQALRQRGAAVASLHPLMTFVPNSEPQLAGVPFGFEGDRAAATMARRIVRDLKGEFFLVPKDRKSAYHTWGAFTSPLLLAALVSAEEAAEIAGIDRATARRRMLPIIRQTIANYASHGPAGAFSGPIIRGDIETIARHLRALRGSPVREVYIALARSALHNLPARNRTALARILG